MFDWSSLLSSSGSNSGGGGGGGAGGSWLGVAQNALARKRDDQSEPESTSAGFGRAAGTALDMGDEINSSIMAPQAQRRAHVVALAQEAPHIGLGIQPVATSRGGAAMVGAMEQNRNDLQDMTTTEGYARLGQKIRQVNAAGGVAKNSAAIIARLVRMFAGGGGGGDMGGGGGYTGATENGSGFTGMSGGI